MNNKSRGDLFYVKVFKITDLIYETIAEVHLHVGY